jgi:hypothetical protein
MASLVVVEKKPRNGKSTSGLVCGVGIIVKE